MRLGPATQAALLSWRFWLAASRTKAITIATPVLESTRAHDTRLRLTRTGCWFSASILPWKEDFGGGRNARAPVHWP